MRLRRYRYEPKLMLNASAANEVCIHAYILGWTDHHTENVPMTITHFEAQKRGVFEHFCGFLSH